MDVPRLTLGALLALTACSPDGQDGSASRGGADRQAVSGEPVSQVECEAVPTGQSSVPAGAYRVGTNARRGEEGPPRRVTTDGFAIDSHEVTNAQFAGFVADTGYVTVAERTPDPADYPEIDPAFLVPGSAVFGVSLERGGFWWRFVPGASWRAPYGPGSTIDGLDRHPVVHVAYEDALAYAHWSQTDLPSETEWEIAARGGLEGAEYTWGDEFRPGGEWRANTWQGPFPAIDIGEDGHQGLAPVGCYEPNGYGLYDMAGNVWEWTSTPFDAGCNTGTIRGGSYLCAPSYCARFRPAARQPQEWDFSASHIGFRTIERVSAEAG